MKFNPSRWNWDLQDEKLGPGHQWGWKDEIMMEQNDG